VAARLDGADANALSLSLGALDSAGVTPPWVGRVEPTRPHARRDFSRASAAESRTRVETVDPTRSHARLAFDRAPAEPLGQPGAGWALVERLLDRGAVLFALEHVGGGEG